jgi:hypothetical protein
VSRRACAILAFLADQERGGRAEYGLASKEEEGEEEHTTENQEGGERKQRHGEQSCVLWCIYRPREAPPKGCPAIFEILASKTQFSGAQKRNFGQR